MKSRLSVSRRPAFIDGGRSMGEGFYITMETVKNVSVTIGVLTALGGLAWKLFSWINEQKEQGKRLTALEEQHEKDIKEIHEIHDKEIKEIRELHKKDVQELRQYHDEDMKELRNETNDVVKSIQEEQTLMVYAQLACLKGLSEQGCNGPVTEAIDKIEKHINQKAHGQI